MAALHRSALAAPRILRPPRTGGLLVACAVLLVVAVAMFQVNLFSRVTSTSYELNELQRQRAAAQAQNRELEARVAELSSLARVDWQARTKLGMEPAKQRIYVEVNRPLPERQTLPTRFLPPDQPDIQAAEQPFWRWLLRFGPLQ